MFGNFGGNDDEKGKTPLGNDFKDLIGDSSTPLDLDLEKLRRGDALDIEVMEKAAKTLGVDDAKKAELFGKAARIDEIARRLQGALADAHEEYPLTPVEIAGAISGLTMRAYGACKKPNSDDPTAPSDGSFRLLVSIVSIYSDLLKTLGVMAQVQLFVEDIRLDLARHKKGNQRS